jgi:3-phenylpropionate/trans-cinnamate dioxygenase ferredoxin component
LGEWYELAGEDEIDNLMPFDVNGREILVVRSEDKLYAIDNICSHEYSRLSDGELWDNRIYCAKHGSSFDIETGQVKGFPATENIETFRLKSENGKLLVYLEDEY